MKRSVATRWLVLGALLAAPYVVVFVAGWLWLYERGGLMAWLAANAGVTVAAWYLARRWRRPAAATTDIVSTLQPDSRWAPAGAAAWRDVEAIAGRVQGEDVPLSDVHQLWDVVQEVLDVVARHFHPRSRDPALEIPVPHVLRIVELVAADLRGAFTGYVPGAHILTLNDLHRMRELATLGRQFYFLYRVVRLGVNPAAGLLREVREAVGGEMARASTAEIKRWTIGYAVRRTGYYAIQLYSGQLVLSDVEFQAFVSHKSEDDARRAEQREAELSAEPLRVLVLGQVKSGKSSLINALFGETRAAVDVVPTTRGIEPYVLEREGLPRAIILDTAGFAEGTSRQRPFDACRQEVLSADLVLVVCSATSAARAPDRELLDRLRDLFASEPTRILPPLLAVLTHIDQLRPWHEWAPPYDVVRAIRTKSRNIAEAMASVAHDLGLPVASVIPVCLDEARRYNIDDGLLPAILHELPEAQRVKYQRCLRQFRDDHYWQQLWQQAARSGRLLWQTLNEP